ncbi:Hypothetical protein A7982_02579 [Minicystis rosea]|nr:Hypothetical protein A7982_02579 [Minicystis rosea]
MTIIEDGIDLPFLHVPATTFVADPALADTVEIEYDAVRLAKPTHDPNRYTVHVPTDKAVLSLGAASPTWKTDAGIVGYTNTHIHFETKAHDKTIVSLGGPATTSAIKGHGGKPPVSTEGYSMITAESAWHEATGQHYLFSHEGDISLRTKGGEKRAVVQADHGYVDLNGGEEVNIAGGSVAIGAASTLHFPDVLSGGNFSGSAPSAAMAKKVKPYIDLISAALSVHDLGLKAHKTAKKYKAGELKANEYLFVDVIKWAGDSIKFGKSVVKIKKAFAKAPSPPGCVKIGAEKDVGALAGKDVSLTGASGASMASALSASVSAVLTATMKGALFAGVGSTFTSIKAQKKLEVGSTWGDVVFSAKKNIELSSVQEVVAGAANDAQVTGKKHLLVGGGKRAWIGAEPGWGALFDDKGVAFGQATGAADMKTAAIAASPAIRIDDDKIEIAGTSGAVTLSNDLCLVEAPGIRFDAKQKNVIFNSQKAQIRVE